MFVADFMAQRSMRTRNFLGVRQYVYKEAYKHMQATTLKHPEKSFPLFQDNQRKKENYVYKYMERIRDRDLKKIRFYEYKLYMRMQKKWIDFKWIKIQKVFLKCVNFIIIM